MKLKPPKKVQYLAEDTQKVFDVLNHDSDLACVLIGTSYLSELLGSAIRTSLRKGNTTENLLNPGRGVLVSFKSRVDLAYCLKIIEKKDREDLDIIGKIRNSFAHRHLSFDFSNKEVENECNNLNAWKLKLNTEEINSDPQIKNIPEFIISCDTTRQKFVISVVMIQQRILVAGLSQNIKNSNN